MLKGELQAQPNKQCTVYFVDDDRGMVSATSQWLTLSGLDVRAFADPKQLLKTIKPGEFSVLVSDVRMPDLDGMSLMSLVHRKDPGIPVILITGHGDIPLAVEAMKAGAYQFLPKPFSPEELLKVVCEAQVVRKNFLDDRERTMVVTSEVMAGQNLEPAEEDTSTLGNKVDEYEKGVIENALKRHKGNVANVLEELDIPRRTLNSKMLKFGISRKSFKD